MASAELTLRKQDPKTAMTPRTNGLEYLQAAEQEHERSSPSRAAAWRRRAQANDLADLSSSRARQAGEPA